ncbi:uncharacterized protein LOC132261094 isoform X2 [Phlebotomus argentipes]|uniref:uncharacterized protein LOC132261094 isoform X2 n=1 Tax=Phlebotomus argentipes TaxID=94469 RepID=UPI00289314BE|nr:uncharacterized protein LOC132261094 isoform X2 [Phlebotomus argentipes]
MRWVAHIVIFDKNCGKAVRQDLSQTTSTLASSLAIPETPRVSDDESDYEEEAWESLLTATRSLLYTPNSLMDVETSPHEHLRKIIDVMTTNASADLAAKTLNEMWSVVLNIVPMVKVANEKMNLRSDLEFKLITIDLLTQYVNFKARVTEVEISNRYITADELERKREDLYMKIFLLLDSSIEDILMLLMSLDVQKKYDGMLYPLFKNVLTNPTFHQKLDTIKYVRRILCFRKWRKLTPHREEKKKIYDYAKMIIPRIMPTSSVKSQVFCQILAPISRRKKQMTRFLLKSKHVDEQKQVQDFFRLWKTSVMINEKFFSVPKVQEADLQSTFTSNHQSTQGGRSLKDSGKS